MGIVGWWSKKNITTSILTIGIAILAHLSMSMCGIWMMLHFDEKKTSVRDSWKYKAKYFRNFKLPPVPLRKFEWLIYFTKFLFVLMYLGMSITLVILATRNHSNIFMVMGIVGILDMIFNYVYLGFKIIKLIKLNSRYNELKTILLNDELNEETSKECAKKKH